MTGNEIKDLVGGLGLTRSQLAVVFGVSAATAYRWMKRGHKECEAGKISQILFSLLSKKMDLSARDRTKWVNELQQITHLQGTLAAIRFIIKE